LCAPCNVQNPVTLRSAEGSGTSTKRATKKPRRGRAIDRSVIIEARGDAGRPRLPARFDTCFEAVSGQLSAFSIQPEMLNSPFLFWLNADRLSNHSIHRDAQVLDVPVLHADRNARRAVKAARLGGREQLGKLRLSLGSLCRRGSAWAFSDHAYIIATVKIDFINDFWPPALYTGRP
jgi:hypothetical protein